MRRKKSKVLLLVFTATLLINLVSQPNKVYAYTATPMVATGTASSYALKSDGTVYAWGYNGDGQIGNNTKTKQPSPVNISLSNVKSIFGLCYSSMALLNNGQVMVWGSNAAGTLGIGGSVTNGPNNPDGYTVPTLHPTLSNINRISDSCYYSKHFFAFQNDGTILYWGYNCYGQLGNGTATIGYTPTRFTALSNIKNIATGTYHTLFLLNDGSVYACGYGMYGQIGINSTSTQKTPVLVSTLSNISKIAAGGHSSFAISNDGTVYAWGRNDSGQLGIGSVTNTKVPTVVPGLNGANIVKIVVSGFNAFALMSDGTVKASGANNYGQLGSSTSATTSFITVPGINDAIDIAAGSDIETTTGTTHVLILKSNGSTYSLGCNTSGQLGLGASDTSKHYGVTIPGLVLDVTPPDAPTLNPNITNPTNGNVIVTVNYPSDATVKQYRIDSGSWTTYTSPVTISANGTIYARCQDAAGNWSTESSYVVNNIDKDIPQAPSINEDITTPTNGNVIVTIVYPTDIAVKQYRIDSGSWTTYTSPVTMTANGTVYARCQDAAGNWSSESSIVVNNIDKVAPQAPSLSANITSPTNGDVLVTITNPSDAAVKQYRINSGNWTTYTSPVAITTNGTVYARCQDAAGNWSSEGSIIVNNIDKVAPVITIDPYNTNPTNQDVTVTASTDKGTLNSTSHTFTQNGDFEFVATDVAGNVTRKTVTITNIDKIAPIITVGSYNTNLTNSDITVNVTANEGTLNNTSHTFTSNGSFEFVATDAVGNVSKKTVTITNIDKEAPIITIGAYNTDPTNQDITVAANTNEGSLNVTSHTFTSNDSFEFIATDAAGNITKKTVTITNIDKEAPLITIEPYNSDPTNQDIVVTASTNEGSLNVLSHTFTSNGSFDFIATDAAGNVTIEIVIITNIDKTAPIIYLGSYNTNPTNQDITVTAFANKGTLNVSSHTFTENGNFEFKATDDFGNITTKAVTITNIDKDAPSKPVIKVNDNELTIVSGMDSESGVKATLYQLNNGNWLIYSDVVTLADGTYVINAKTVDNAGNESSYDTINASTNKNALNTATDALVKAENTYIQSDLDKAMTLINALPDSPEKTDLMDRASNLQKIINDKKAINEATRALVKAENSYIQEDLDKAIVLINALPDGPEKTNLTDRANNLQKIIDDKKAISEATKALVIAEHTYIQADLDAALVLINALPDSPEKIDLINRANDVQKIIDNNNAIIFTSDTDEVLNKQMVNLTIKVPNLEDLYTMQYEIRYDPERLELDQTNIRNLVWEDGLNGYSAIDIDSSNGVVKIIYSLRGDVSGVSNKIDLLGLQFKALQIGKTTVEVSKITITNSQGKKIVSTTSSTTEDIDVLPNPLNVTLTGDKGQSDWYISPVTVEINDLDAKAINYSIDGVKHSYTQPFSIDEIGDHDFVVTTDDGNGNIKEKSLEVKIDNNGPMISVSNENCDWQNEVKVTSELDDQDGSGISQGWYQWSITTDEPAQWEEYNQEELTQATEGIWYLHIKATDKAGNISQTLFGPYKIDNSVPEISVDNNKREDWDNTDVFVTPTFVDGGGLQLKNVGYQWSLEQTLPTEYTPYTSGSLQQSDDGVWYLHLIAEDEAGNIRTIMYGPYNIDKSAPSIEFSGVSEGVDYLDTITPVITVSDVLSGIDMQITTLDGQPYVSGTPITDCGPHTITVFADDNSGNTITKTISFRIVYKPEAVIDMTPSADLTDTTPITWSYENSTDPNGESIISAEWQLDDKPVTTNPNGCVTLGSHTMKLRVENSIDIWSDWVPVTFTVGYVYTIYPENITQLGTLSSGTINSLFDGDLDNQAVFDAEDPDSGIEFTLLEPSILYALSGSAEDTGDLYLNGGMEVYLWNTDTSTYDYLGKTAVTEDPDTWYQVFNFTQPGKYKLLATQPNYQGYSEWEIKAFFNNQNTPPDAVISMSPELPDNSTNITWNYISSFDADDDSIISVEWQLDDGPVTANPDGVILTAGTHTMKLRVKDRKGTWSEWASITFDVSES